MVTGLQVVQDFTETKHKANMKIIHFPRKHQPQMVRAGGLQIGLRAEQSQFAFISVFFPIVLALAWIRKVTWGLSRSPDNGRVSDFSLTSFQITELLTWKITQKKKEYHLLQTRWSEVPK